MGTPLTALEIDLALRSLPGWKRKGEALEKTFTFTDFSQALGFIVRIGVEAERLNHHPEINKVWSRVTLRLSTHDAGDHITGLDVKLATVIEKVAS